MTFIMKLVLLILLSLLNISECKYEVFLIPHTHIDQGWLKTIDGYRGNVHGILNSVIKSLKSGAHRKFNWGEVYYFKYWYEAKSDSEKKYIDHLIASGRFAFTGFGIVQNDEACPTYTSIIDQITHGVTYLKEKFNIEPKIAWQIDPFGHDIRMVEILSQMGFEAIFLNRVHFNIKQTMKNDKALEFIWKVGRHEIFAHTLWHHYASPPGFDFEKGSPSIHSGNVKSRSLSLMNYIKGVAKHHRTNHIFTPLGDDFKFHDANRQYSNLDLLIDYINKNYGGQFHVRYATLQEYVDSLSKYSKKKKIEFPVVSHDFFPYQDHKDAWWSGYYTTWPKLKRQIRKTEEKLFNFETLFAMGNQLLDGGAKGKVFNALNNVRIESATSQHHDYITGTSRRAVINDYIKRLEISEVNAKNHEKQMIAVLLHKRKEGKVLGYDEIRGNGNSLLDVDKTVLTSGKTYQVAIFNPIFERSSFLSIISATKHVVVRNWEGEVIPHQISPKLFEKNLHMESENAAATFSIGFTIRLSPLSLQKVSIEVKDSGGSGENDENFLYYVPGNSASKSQINPVFKEDLKAKKLGKNSDLQISNEHYAVVVSPKSGYLSAIIDKANNNRIHTYKNNMWTHFQTRKSGAYIFRPPTDSVPFDDELRNVYVKKGPIFDEMIVITKRFRMRYRLIKRYYEEPNSFSLFKNYIFFEYYVEPIEGNTELILQFSLDTTKASDNEFSMLSFNGLHYTKRDINRKFGPYPIAGQYYPSPNGGILRTNEYQLNVFTKYTQAMSSKDSNLKFMVHRRLSTDDFRGMSQGNNDNTEVQSSLLLSYSDKYEKKNEFSDTFHISEYLNRPISVYIVGGGLDKKLEGHVMYFNQKKINKNLVLVSFQVTGGSNMNTKTVLRVRNVGFTNIVPFHNPFNEKIISKKIKFIEKSLDLFYDQPPKENHNKFVKGTEILMKFYETRAREGMDHEYSPLFRNENQQKELILQKRKLLPQETKTFLIDNASLKFLSEGESSNGDDDDSPTQIEQGEEEVLITSDDVVIESGQPIVRQKLREEIKEHSFLRPRRNTMIVYCIVFTISMLLIYFFFTTSRGKRSKNIQKLVRKKKPRILENIKIYN